MRRWLRVLVVSRRGAGRRGGRVRRWVGDASSWPMRRTGCVSAVSPSTAAMRAGSHVRSYSTCSHVVWWAGRLRTTCAPSSSSTPWMARVRRRPTPVGGTVLLPDRSSQCTSWLFGHRLREAGLLGSMGKVACACANALMEPSGARCRSSSEIDVFGGPEPSSPQRGSIRPSSQSLRALRTELRETFRFGSAGTTA